SHGVLQPLVVRTVGDSFQLIAGERRLRAAQAAGLSEVPVHVVHFDDQQVFEAALVENIQRSDLNPIEKAQGFKDYLDRFGLTQEQLGAKLGLDRTTVTNLLGLLNLPPEVQDAVRLGQISLGHAKVLKGVPEPERQVALCRETMLKNYSVHALELLVKQQKLEAAQAGAARTTEAAPAEKTAHVKGIEDDLRQRLATRVEIKVRAKDKGQIVIGFETNDDFERIIDALRR
ncbi:MAG: ParB/RepB/Spo0J family partition protein, partial [Gemmataceae bacterium]|nr:ParB/RepB/Spo0J family partition protein [Gemmataceae bacterium]